MIKDDKNLDYPNYTYEMAIEFLRSDMIKISTDIVPSNK